MDKVGQVTHHRWIHLVIEMYRSILAYHSSDKVRLQFSIFFEHPDGSGYALYHVIGRRGITPKPVGKDCRRRRRSQEESCFERECEAGPELIEKGGEVW